MVSQCESVKLASNMKLKLVMYVPSLRHNLLSVQKLTTHEGRKVVFHPNVCIIQDFATSHVRGVGKVVNEIYYFINSPIQEVLQQVNQLVNKKKEETTNLRMVKNSGMTANTELRVPTTVEKQRSKVNLTSVWHHRLDHAPLQRIQKISKLEGFNLKKAKECITCHIAKFTKLPFKQSTSRASEHLSLFIYMDIWGP